MIRAWLAGCPLQVLAQAESLAHPVSQVPSLTDPETLAQLLAQQQGQSVPGMAPLQILPLLTRLSLHGCGIEHINAAVLAPLTSLCELVLSCNQLTSLEALQALGVGGSGVASGRGSAPCALTTLDVGHNRLARLESAWLEGLGLLTHLSLDHNALHSLDDLRMLKG